MKWFMLSMGLVLLANLIRPIGWDAAGACALAYVAGGVVVYGLWVKG